ncbi:hypothetical protein SAMN05216387_1087 [Nitrosovibrio tenuis]|uniref:Uncharacterized protein n=1 Tax=Nitrosovibrio tenuis TaxID=1233 RepID=A0A1H7P1Y0_9PROT|nr:hypothetical protein SAMN05216387_1087 [Nitrosovibrio tenuis]
MYEGDISPVFLKQARYFYNIVFKTILVALFICKFQSIRKCGIKLFKF